MNDKAIEQELAYGRLLNQRITDLEQWQDAHRILPEASSRSLLAANLRLGWKVAVDQLLLLTETPAQTATRLGGLVDYDERVKTAVFNQRDSAEIFSKRYPDWCVQVGSKEAETV